MRGALPPLPLYNVVARFYFHVVQYWRLCFVRHRYPHRIPASAHFSIHFPLILPWARCAVTRLHTCSEIALRSNIVHIKEERRTSSYAFIKGDNIELFTEFQELRAMTRTHEEFVPWCQWYYMPFLQCNTLIHVVSLFSTFFLTLILSVSSKLQEAIRHLFCFRGAQVCFVSSFNDFVPDVMIYIRFGTVTEHIACVWNRNISNCKSYASKQAEVWITFT
jgi:hypothetical protein